MSHRTPFAIQCNAKHHFIQKRFSVVPIKQSALLLLLECERQLKQNPQAPQSIWCRWRWGTADFPGSSEGGKCYSPRWYDWQTDPQRHWSIWVYVACPSGRGMYQSGRRQFLVYSVLPTDYGIALSQVNSSESGQRILQLSNKPSSPASRWRFLHLHASGAHQHMLIWSWEATVSWHTYFRSRPSTNFASI